MEVGWLWLILNTPWTHLEMSLLNHLVYHNWKTVSIFCFDLQTIFLFKTF